MITIRHAISDDSDALIQLTALTPMNGSISLRIDRKPDFFHLLNQRGDSLVLLAEDEHKNIIGSFSAARQYFQVCNNTLPVYYLGDLKVHPGYTGTTIAYRLVKEMHKQLTDAGADLLFCTAAFDNDTVMPFFNGRSGIPAFKKTGCFFVYQLLPKRCNDYIAPNPVNEAALKNFYDEFNKRYDFSPTIHFHDHCIHFISYQDGNITAALTLFDPIQLKQNVIVGFPWQIRFSLSLLRSMKGLLQLPPLPRKGNPLRILYVKFAGYLPGYKNAFLNLIESARHYAFINDYHFVSVTVNEKDELLNKLVKPKSRFIFQSMGLITSLQNNTELVDRICNGLPYEDYSLV